MSDTPMMSGLRDVVSQSAFRAWAELAQRRTDELHDERALADMLAEALRDLVENHGDQAERLDAIVAGWAALAAYDAARSQS